MIAPCPFFPHDVGVFDSGSAAFFSFPVLTLSLLGVCTYVYVRVSLSRVYLSLRTYTGTTVFDVIIIVVIVVVIVIVIIVILCVTCLSLSRYRI